MSEGDPRGCLACNPDAVSAFLVARGVDPKRFTQCPPPRHKWADVTAPCGECGATFLVEKVDP